MKILITFSLILNIYLIYSQFDNGVHLTYLEHSNEFQEKLQNNLLQDLNDVYLCKELNEISLPVDSKKLSANKINLNGLSLHIRNDIIVDVTLQGWPPKQEVCQNLGRQNSHH